ncbi:MAG: hypothetical protein ACOY9J_10385 [Pseudomonadota bacterium]
MATTKVAKVKSPFNELIERVEQLTDRVRQERAKQLGRLEEQLDKARKMLGTRLDNLNVDKLKDLQETYREKAEDALRSGADTVKKAVVDAGDQLRDSRAAHALLKAELNALQFATKQAQEVARVLSTYEKQVQKQLTQVERSLGKAAVRNARKTVKKAAPRKAKPVAKAAAKPKAQAKTTARRKTT